MKSKFPFSKRLALAAILLSVISTNPAAHAEEIPIPNNDFAAPDWSVKGWVDGWAPKNWTSSLDTGVGVINPDRAGKINYPTFAASWQGLAESLDAEGRGATQAAYINSYPYQELISLVSGDLDAVSDNTTYTLSVAIGKRGDFRSGTVTIGLITADGLELAKTEISGLSSEQTPWTFVRYSATFISKSSASVGKPLRVILTQTYDQPTGGLFQIATFADVRLDAEPLK